MTYSLYSLIIILLLPLLLFSAEEAGHYARSSITHMNTVFLLDSSARQLSSDQTGNIPGIIQNELTMPRFDFNPIPEPLKEEFAAATSGTMTFSHNRDEALEEITDIITATVVPHIVKIVELKSDMRARGLLTEQEQNSFITDKAREMGITAEHIQQVMNSAYIYVPVVQNYAREIEEDNYSESMDIGLIWWKIIHEEQGAKAVVMHSDFRNSSGYSTIGNTYIVNGREINHRQFAFYSMIQFGARDLAVATRRIEEFCLTGQVLSGNSMKMHFNLGKQEGLNVDDRYLIIRDEIREDGTRESRRAGWGFVRNVGDSLDTQGYQSRAQMVSGYPRIGSKVREYPRLPFDVSYGYRYFPYSFTENNGEIEINSGHGFEIGINANTGRDWGVSHLFTILNIAVGFHNAEGELNFDGVRLDVDSPNSNFAVEMGMMKKFYLRRLASVVAAGGTYSTISVSGKDYFDDIDLENRMFGGFGAAGLEVALSPALNLGTMGKYWVINDSDQWNYSDDDLFDESFRGPTIAHSTGISIQTYLTYSIPSFDPDSWF